MANMKKGQQSIQGAELSIPNPGLTPINHIPGLGFNDFESAKRRANTADPHTEILAVEQHKDTSVMATISLYNQEKGTGKFREGPE